MKIQNPVKYKFDYYLIKSTPYTHVVTNEDDILSIYEVQYKKKIIGHISNNPLYINRVKNGESALRIYTPNIVIYHNFMEHKHELDKLIIFDTTNSVTDMGVKMITYFLDPNKIILHESTKTAAKSNS